MTLLKKKKIGETGEVEHRLTLRPKNAEILIISTSNKTNYFNIEKYFLNGEYEIRVLNKKFFVQLVTKKPNDENRGVFCFFEMLNGPSVVPVIELSSLECELLINFCKKYIVL